MKFIPRDRVSRNGSKVKEGMCDMKFHVTDTTKPLASAMAVVKMGNKVVLDDGGSYIENEATGERIELKEAGGTYMFEIDAMQGAPKKSEGFIGRG